MKRPMKPKSLLFLMSLVLMLGSSCSKKSQSPSLDEVELSETCKQLNLVRDASWSAGFVKNFVTCLNEGSESGQEKFSTTLDILNKLGQISLQSTLDLFRFQADKLDVFLGLTSSLIDRGADAGPDRWTKTQKLLEDTKPFAFAKLLMELKRKNLLNPLLDTLQSADENLPQGFIETGLRQVLADEKIKSDLTYLLKAFLADEKAFSAFNKFLAPKRKALDPSCSMETCAYPGAAELKSGSQHWLDFWVGLSDEQRDRLALAVAQVMKGTLEADDNVAQDRAQRVSDLAMETVGRSSNVYQQVYEALDVLLNTKLSSFEPFIEGLNNIKDDPNYRDAFEEKLGSSLLQDKMMNFLWQGGRPEVCSESIPGLSSATAPKSRESLIKGLLNVNPSCGGNSPSLAMLSELMGYSCGDSSCKVDLFNDSSGVDLNELMSQSFRKIGASLQVDPFVLLRLGAARSEISPLLWKEITSRVTPVSETMELINLEKSLYEAYPKVLAKDWLELSLGRTLQEMSELEQSFSGLYLDRDIAEQWYNGLVVDPNEQMSRAVFGLYNGGSAEQVLNQIYSVDQIEKAWKSKYPDSKITRRDLAQLVAPLRSIASHYKNPKASFKPDQEVIALPWLGSIQNQAKFTASGQAEAEGNELSFDLLFDTSDMGFGINKRYSNQLRLATASLPLNEAKIFEAWLLDDYLAKSPKLAKEVRVGRQKHASELMDIKKLSHAEARNLVFFLGTQFTRELSLAPEGAKISSTPLSNSTPRDEAARVLAGAAALGGSRSPWTSFWLMQNSVLSSSNQSFDSMRKALASGVQPAGNSFKEKSLTPTLISQGSLDPFDADALHDHAKLLIQLQLMSPILEQRKQYFVPSVGFDKYCPKRKEKTWEASACPFSYDSAESYGRFLDDRFVKTFCGVLPNDGESLGNVLEAMGLTDTPQQILEMCADHKATLRWRKDIVSNIINDALALGKNPKLKEGFKGLPANIRWLKAQEYSDGHEALKVFLSHTPVLDSQTSAVISAKAGINQAFYSHSPGAISVWFGYLSRFVKQEVLSATLKKFGNLAIAGQERPVQEFLRFVVDDYRAATAHNKSTLEFSLGLLTKISQEPYLREVAMGLFGKPYDPYSGILIAYTTPLAIDAGTFPDFSWETYAPLRLLLQSQNLELLQGLTHIYDRNAMEWLDQWTKVSESFPSIQVMANDFKPILIWLKSFAATHSAEDSAELKDLALMRNWSEAVASSTRIYRLLRVSLPDLSNQWHKAFYFETPALAKTFLETAPRLLSLKEQFELEGGDQNLMPDSLLGIMQGFLKNDSNEMVAWFQDSRMGFRSPSFWGSALRDPAFRNQLDNALLGFDQTDRADWQKLRVEWDTLGPHSSKLISYVANNVVLKNPDALYQKEALSSFARVTSDPERWGGLGKVFDSWLDDESVLKTWQTKYSNEKGQ